MNRIHVLIAGCGDVGCELARQLLSQNDRFSVWGLRRNISKLPEGVNPVVGDLTDANSLGDWPEKIDYVVYSAATDGRGEENYRKAYVDGLKNVLFRLHKDGYKPARLFFTSSTSVYHQSNGEWIDETSETLPQSYSGKIMLEAETILQNSSYSATAIRFGGIYGPGRNRLINRVKEGEGCQPEPVIFGNRIHRDDCAGIIAHLINRDLEGSSIDSLYLGVDNYPAPMHEVLHWLATKMNIELDDSFPPPARANKRCRNDRITKSGYLFIFPDFRVGYSKPVTSAQC